MKTRIFILFVLLLFLLTACGKAVPTAENTNAPLETEMQGSAGDSNAVIPSQESDDSASNNADSQTKPASSSFRCEPVTFDGYSLTPEGDSVPVRLTMAVENVLEGEAAWQQMISQGTQLPAPEQGKEYILVTVKVTYEDGDLETLNFVENYPASWAAARVHFNIPNDNSNTEDVTYNLVNLEVGVENLNTDSPRYCIYRPHTTPIVANSASDLAEYINWHRMQPEDSYTNWNPSMIIYE